MIDILLACASLTHTTSCLVSPHASNWVCHLLTLCLTVEIVASIAYVWKVDLPISVYSIYSATAKLSMHSVHAYEDHVAIRVVVVVASSFRWLFVARWGRITFSMTIWCSGQSEVVDEDGQASPVIGWNDLHILYQLPDGSKWAEHGSLYDYEDLVSCRFCHILIMCSCRIASAES